MDLWTLSFSHFANRIQITVCLAYELCTDPISSNLLFWSAIKAIKGETQITIPSTALLCFSSSQCAEYAHLWPGQQSEVNGWQFGVVPHWEADLQQFCKLSSRQNVWCVHVFAWMIGNNVALFLSGTISAWPSASVSLVSTIPNTQMIFTGGRPRLCYTAVILVLTMTCCSQYLTFVNLFDHSHHSL